MRSRRMPVQVLVAGCLGWAASMAVAADEPEAAAVATIPVTAKAQDPAPAPEQKNEQTTALPEVVVTANKREQVLRDIPASIAAVDGEQLERSGAQDLGDYLKLVPGVNIVYNEPGATKVTVRGISSELGTNATTGTLFGSISFNDAFFPFVSLDPNPFDMNDVEVLKGPQGTLYGASALNGAVRYVPRAPELGQSELKYFAQYTKLSEGGGDPIYGAAINLPLGKSDEAALRLVGFDRRSPGYIDDTVRGLEDVNRVRQDGERAILAWQPGERWDLSAMYARQHTQYPDEPFADNREGRLSRNDTPVASPKDSFYDLGHVSIGYKLDWAEVVSETALVRKRFDQATNISRVFTGAGTSTSTVDTTIFFNSDTLSQELRLRSPGKGGRWSWIGGVFWQDQKIDSGYDIFTAQALPIGTLVPLPSLAAIGAPAAATADGNLVLGHQRSDVVVRELALFADVTRQLWERWEASLGVRAYRTTSGGVAAASGALYGGVENRNEGEVRERGVNPKASLRWRVSDTMQIYALVSRGFRVGGLQPTASKLSSSIPTQFKSDTLWNYELGLRTQWLGNSLLLDLTAFLEKWDKPLLAQRDPNNPNPVATYYDNVGAAKSTGAESALLYRLPIDGLSLSFSAAYAKTVTTVPFKTATGVQTQPGTQWPFAPKWQTATVLAYVVPVFGSWQASASATRTSTSTAYTTLVHDIQVFGYQAYDLRIGLADTSARWPEISLSVDNLRDQRGIVQDVPAGAVNPTHDVIYVRPRAVTLHLGGRF